MKSKLLTIAAAAAVGMGAAGSALAESTYGYSAAGSGTVTATARLNLSVTVAKLILLRVGSTNTTVDTASWTVGATIPGAGTTTPVTGGPTQVDWSGAAPTITSSGVQTFTVYAWTNAGAGTINCALGAWSAAGGPANANFAVTTAGTLPHPGANLGACASTSFPSNVVATGTWQYALGGTPTSWTPGTYTNVVTYTASGI